MTSVRRLPARFAVAAARAAAIAAVAAAAAESARALRLGARFVDGQPAAAQLVVVQLGDRLLRLVVRAHLHERETARAPGRHVAHHLHRFHGAGAGEQILQIGLAGFVRKIAHVKSATHLSHSSVADATTVEVLVSSLSGISGGASWKLVSLERQHSTGKTFTDARQHSTLDLPGPDDEVRIVHGEGGDPVPLALEPDPDGGGPGRHEFELAEVPDEACRRAGP